MKECNSLAKRTLHIKSSYSPCLSSSLCHVAFVSLPNVWLLLLSLQWHLAQAPWWIALEIPQYLHPLETELYSKSVFQRRLMLAWLLKIVPVLN
jgi:hypothetical protein